MVAVGEGVDEVVQVAIRLCVESTLCAVSRQRRTTVVVAYSWRKTNSGQDEYTVKSNSFERGHDG